MSNILTYNQIFAVIQDQASRHPQIHSWIVAPSYDAATTKYMPNPVLYIRPIKGTYFKSVEADSYPVKELQVELILVDLVNKSEDNRNDVDSDTHQILSDFITELNEHPYYQRSGLQLVGDIEIEQIDGWSDDDANGVKATLTLRLRNSTSFCSLPFSSIPGFSFPGPESTAVTYSVSYLSCETVTGCTILQNYIANEIALIPTSTGGTSGNLWSASTGVNSIIANNGTGNIASGSFSIIGGSGNSTSNSYTFIGNGKSNYILNSYASIINGSSHYSYGSFSTIAGGKNNKLGSNYGFIGAGYKNLVNGAGANIVVGGGFNTATTSYATIVGGKYNLSYGSYSFIGGGNGNKAISTYSSIVGGFLNANNGSASFIGGGQSNLISGIFSFIGAGKQNSTTTDYSIIIGGVNNLASGGYHSFVGGGAFNSALGAYSSILNGSGNTASGIASAIIGGTGHTVTGRNSAIIGGGSINGTANDTVYVPYLNINKLYTGSTAVAGLAIDINGNVITGSSASSLSSVLALGNTTGTNNILMSPSTYIKNTFDDTYISMAGSKILNLGIYVSPFVEHSISITDDQTLIYNTSSIALNSPILTKNGVPIATVDDIKPQSSGLWNDGNSVTINADPTLIDIDGGDGIIEDYWTTPGTPVKYTVTWPARTDVTVDNLLTSTQSYIGIDKDGNVVQFASIPTNTQRRDTILLAQLGHADKTTVKSVNHYVSYFDSPIETARDIIREFRLINEGNLITANGANLNINKSAGYLFGMGINEANDIRNANKLYLSGQTAASFRYRTQTGGTTSTVTNIDGSVYDLGGVITSVPGGANAASNQRVHLFPNGNIVIQYGQTTYTTLAAAIAGLQSENFTTFQNLADSAMLIGILSVRKGASDLSNTSDARFIPVSKIGENIGGTAGISVSTLQNTYNNSSEPEILTNSTLGAVTIKDGFGGNVIEFQNTGGTITTYITGDGTISTNKVTGLADAVNPTDAVNLAQIDRISAPSNLFNFYNFS